MARGRGGGAYGGFWRLVEAIGVRDARARWERQSPFLQRAVPPLVIAVLVILVTLPDRREVGRLLAEGHEGRFVLIKGEEVIGLFDTREQALEVGSDRFLLQPKLIQRILTREPVLLITPRYI